MSHVQTLIPRTTVPDAIDCRDMTLSEIERSLSGDRHGEITAVVVDAGTADAVRAVIERCWHDAALIVSSMATDARRAA